MKKGTCELSELRRQLLHDDLNDHEHQFARGAYAAIQWMRSDKPGNSPSTFVRWLRAQRAHEESRPTPETDTP